MGSTRRPGVAVSKGSRRSSAPRSLSFRPKGGICFPLRSSQLKRPGVCSSHQPQGKQTAALIHSLPQAKSHFPVTNNLYREKQEAHTCIVRENQKPSSNATSAFVPPTSKANSLFHNIFTCKSVLMIQYFADRRPYRATLTPTKQVF